MRALAILTDADACLPESIRADLGIVTVPADARPYEQNRWSAAPEPAPVPVSAVVEAVARAASEAHELLYVAAAGGFGIPREHLEAAAAALGDRAGGPRMHIYDSHAALMGCGWQTVAAALVAGHGGGLEEARAAAASVGRSIRVLAMLEQSRVPDAEKSGLTGWMRNRVLARLPGGDIQVLTRPKRRDEGLVALRDRLGLEAAVGAGALRIAVHHTAAEPAAQAMARWAERTLHPEEVVVTPLTEHAAARLGPGMVAFAWYREDAASG